MKGPRFLKFELCDGVGFTSPGNACGPWREVSAITPLDAKLIVSQHRRPGTRTSKPHLKMKTQNPTGTKAEQDRAGPGGAGSACAGILWRQAGKSYSPAGNGGLFLLPISSTFPEESVERVAPR